MTALDSNALDQLFRTARSQNGWLPRPLTEAQLRALYDLMKFGPTSANCSPMRVVFVTTEAGKRRLAPALSAGNLPKVMQAPVTAILGYRLDFYEWLPRLFPHNLAARTWFEGKPAHIEATAFRNGTLQGAYLMLAARAIGLDCGPMSGFDAAKVDAEFFPDGKTRTNFICSLGYGDPSKIMARHPRLDFEEACTVV
ncbi:MAG: malonic semialdehyde reductase [Alphaproteobacteria bacterium]|nr:malonic semialdehyde reductase [Alphaproteobacteria bacterium]